MVLWLFGLECIINRTCKITILAISIESQRNLHICVCEGGGVCHRIYEITILPIPTETWKMSCLFVKGGGGGLSVPLSVNCFS